MSDEREVLARLAQRFGGYGHMAGYRPRPHARYQEQLKALRRYEENARNVMAYDPADTTGAEDADIVEFTASFAAWSLVVLPLLSEHAERIAQPEPGPELTWAERHPQAVQALIDARGNVELVALITGLSGRSIGYIKSEMRKDGLL